MATHRSLRPVSILAALRQYGQQIVTAFNRSADGRSSRPTSMARSHAGQLVAIVSSDVPVWPIGLAAAAAPMGRGRIGRSVGSVGRDGMGVLRSKSCSQFGTAQTGACRTPSPFPKARFPSSPSKKCGTRRSSFSPSPCFSPRSGSFDAQKGCRKVFFKFALLHRTNITLFILIS